MFHLVAGVAASRIFKGVRLFVGQRGASNIAETRKNGGSTSLDRASLQQPLHLNLASRSCSFFATRNDIRSLFVA